MGAGRCPCEFSICGIVRPRGAGNLHTKGPVADWGLSPVVAHGLRRVPRVCSRTLSGLSCARQWNAGTRRRLRHTVI
jgi:hypothetical protein